MTSGLGAIHLFNGLYGAKADRVPVLAIVSQSARNAVGGDYQQACGRTQKASHGVLEIIWEAMIDYEAAPDSALRTTK